MSSFPSDPNDDSNDASFPHDYHDQFENGTFDEQQAQSNSRYDDDYQAGVQDVNFLLETLSMKAARPVFRLSQLSSSFFVLAFRQLFGEVPEGINISPATIDDRISNARAVIESIESKVDMSLAHISPELIAEHNELEISKLLRVFVDILNVRRGADGDEYNEDEEDEDQQDGDEYEDDEQQPQATAQQQRQHHYLFSSANNAAAGGGASSVNAQYQGSRQGQQSSVNSRGQGAVLSGRPSNAATNPSAVVQQQPQVTRVRDWLTGLYAPQSNNASGFNAANNNNGSFERNPDEYNMTGADSTLPSQQQQQQRQQEASSRPPPPPVQPQPQQAQQYPASSASPPFDQQQQQQQQQQQLLLRNAATGGPSTVNNVAFGGDGVNNTNASAVLPSTFQQQQQQQQLQSSAEQNFSAALPLHRSQGVGIERRVRRVADFIERSNVPRYEPHVCDRLTDGDGRYIRHFTGDGPLSTIGIATAQKKSTTTNAASMAARPLPAMSNARRDAKIERLRSEKFLQGAQDRAVREVVRQSSREEVRMVQELKQQLREQRETFLSLDKLAKEKDHRLRQIYADNVVSAIGASKSKNIKLSLHKNAADLVRRERAVVEREKQECESEIRLQFEVLRAKREAYLSHLSSWRVAVMKQPPQSSVAFAAAAAAAPTSARPGTASDRHRPASASASGMQQQEQQLEQQTIPVAVAVGA